MKKTYIAPGTVWVSVHAKSMLTGSATGGYDSNSITKENDESMSRSSRSLWDDDMD